MAWFTFTAVAAALAQAAPAERAFEGYPTIAVIIASVAALLWILRGYLPRAKNGGATGAHPRLSMPSCEAEKHVKNASDERRREAADIISAARDVSQVAKLVAETIEQHSREAREQHSDLVAEIRQLGKETATLAGVTQTLTQVVG